MGGVQGQQACQRVWRERGGLGNHIRTQPQANILRTPSKHKTCVHKNAQLEDMRQTRGLQVGRESPEGTWTQGTRREELRGPSYNAPSSTHCTATCSIHRPSPLYARYPSRPCPRPSPAAGGRTLDDQSQPPGGEGSGDTTGEVGMGGGAAGMPEGMERERRA